MYRTYVQYLCALPSSSMLIYESEVANECICLSDPKVSFVVLNWRSLEQLSYTCICAFVCIYVCLVMCNETNTSLLSSLLSCLL